MSDFSCDQSTHASLVHTDSNSAALSNNGNNGWNSNESSSCSNNSNSSDGNFGGSTYPGGSGTCVNPNLEVAKEILLRSGFVLGDLPSTVEDPLWTDIKADYKLNTAQIAALKKYAVSMSSIQRPSQTQAQVLPVATAVSAAVPHISSGSAITAMPKTDIDFSFSPLRDLQYFLDSTADVSVRQALLGPGPCLRDILPAVVPSTMLPITDIVIEEMIEEHERWLHLLVDRPPLPLKYLLAIRLYTAKLPIPLYIYLNGALNRDDRSNYLKNVAPYMRLLIKALHLMDVAGYGSEAEAYRGVTIASNMTLQLKYDGYQRAFPPNSLISFAAFTSVSLERTVAELFGDKIFFHFLNVRGVDISSVSAYPTEQEMVVIPPGVFIVNGSSRPDSRLTVNLSSTWQQNATYLTFDDHALNEVMI
jgi:hypothetical protein